MLRLIINAKKRWVVITPSKTGSTSLNRLLISRQFGGTLHMDRWHHDVEIPEWADECRVYLAVRNPYARASSLYRHQWRDSYTPEPISPFCEFIERCLMNRACGEYYWQTITDWWPHDTPPIRLEHWAEDLNLLEPDGPYVIPAENIDPKFEHWSEVYDREPGAASMVHSWARLDFEQFGYPEDLVRSRLCLA